MLTKDMKYTIEKKLTRGINLKHLNVVNESGQHNVPKGAESHFKVVMVSNDFENMTLLARHRKVYDILSECLADGIHALSVHALTEKEWHEKHGETPLSPPCLGGEKRGTN